MRRPSFIVFLWIALVAGCANVERSQPPAQLQVDESVPRIDEKLLSALGLAQSYQYQADELVELDKRPEAIEKVLLVLDIPFPPQAPEREDIRLDAFGRLAELSLDEGNEEGASSFLSKGLSESSRQSYFKARLYAVRGKILRAKAKRLRDEGSVEDSRQASRDAIEAFEKSIDINKQVLGLQVKQGEIAEQGSH